MSIVTTAIVYNERLTAENGNKHHIYVPSTHTHTDTDMRQQLSVFCEKHIEMMKKQTPILWIGYDKFYSFIIKNAELERGEVFPTYIRHFSHTVLYRGNLSTFPSFERLLEDY